VSDQNLDRMMSAASPVTDDQISRLDLGSSEAELMEEIVALRIEEPTTIDGPRSRRRTLRTKIVASVTGVAAISLIAAGLLTSMGSGSKTTFDALAVKVANANQRMLVGASGWKITRADQMTVDDGEITFGNGTDGVDLHWLPRARYPDAMEKFETEGEDKGKAVVLGRDVKIWRYKGTTDYTAYFPPQGSNFVQIRGDLGSEERFRAILSSLRQVDVETWLGAMPPTVVKPQARASAVDAMLTDIPQPPGYDAKALREGRQLRDRYQLGAAVSGSVACGWLDEWMDARAAGDGQRQSAAREAMESSRTWNILVEMKAEGHFPEVLWEIADSMDGDATIPTGRGLVKLTDRGMYANALGCDSF
jgi:hypothetical protein